MKKVIKKLKPKHKKVVCILLIMIILIINLQHEEEKKKYLEQSYQVTLKANSLRQKYWGIEYYFEFNWLFTHTSEYTEIDLDSFEFQEYLQNQYTIFRIKKSLIFLKVLDICTSVLSYQYSDANYQLAALAVIQTLNNNIVDINKIDAKETKKEYLEIYGATTIYTMNIFEILVEQNILTQQNDFFSYRNKGVFNYFYCFSSELMPIIKTQDTEDIRYVTNNDLDILLDVLQNFYDEYLVKIELFRNSKEYPKLKELICDWSSPEQYYEFKDVEIQKIYFDLNKRKNTINDKLFQSIFISSIGLGYYFYSENKPRDNYYYFFSKNEKSNLTS